MPAGAGPPAIEIGNVSVQLVGNRAYVSARDATEAEGVLSAAVGGLVSVRRPRPTGSASPAGARALARSPPLSWRAPLPT